MDTVITPARDIKMQLVSQQATTHDLPQFLSTEKHQKTFKQDVLQDPNSHPSSTIAIEGVKAPSADQKMDINRYSIFDWYYLKGNIEVVPYNHKHLLAN